MNLNNMKIKIILPDEIEYFIEYEILEKIPTLFELVKANKETKEINLPNIDGNIFSTIVKYLRYLDLEDNNHLINKLFENISINIIFDLIISANYLGINSLVDLLGNKFKKIINKNDVSTIRKIFKIEHEYNIDPNDVTNYVWNEIFD